MSKIVGTIIFNLFFVLSCRLSAAEVRPEQVGQLGWRQPGPRGTWRDCPVEKVRPAPVSRLTTHVKCFPLAVLQLDR